MNIVIREELYSGQIIRLTLNAPKANVIDAVMMDSLHHHLSEFTGSTRVKMIQFTGAGDHFSFGASVAEHTKEHVATMLDQFHRLFFTLADLAIPTAALVSGQCLGGGLELALACNFMFADETARLGQPEINLGVFAPPASVILPLKVGQTRADNLLLTGRSLKPDEAADWGMLTALYAGREEMLKGVDLWCEKHILPKSAGSLRFAVKAGRWHFNRQLKKKLSQLQEFYIHELMETHDANEGIEAFLQKRDPRWEGQQ